MKEKEQFTFGASMIFENSKHTIQKEEEEKSDCGSSLTGLFNTNFSEHEKLRERKERLQKGRTFTQKKTLEVTERKKESLGNLILLSITS